jgi:hypothetical protein
MVLKGLCLTHRLINSSKQENDELKKFIQLLETFNHGSTSFKCTSTNLGCAKDVDN